jgi:preprotein translocase subunit SecG
VKTSSYFFLAQIVVAVAMSALVLLQSKDAGLSSMFGGSDMGVMRTRRGVEKTMFNATIGLAVVYVLLSMVTVFVVG